VGQFTFFLGQELDVETRENDVIVPTEQPVTDFAMGVFHNVVHSPGVLATASSEFE
jgi:hypothetical protein